MRQILEPARREWQADIDDRLPHLPWYARDKVKEGSHATLVGIQIHEEENLWNAVAVGDACVIQIRNGSIMQSFPISDASQFNNTPPLLSTLPNELDVRCSTALHLTDTWETGDCFLLATDALAQWLLAESSPGRNGAQTLIEIAQASKGAITAFRALMKRERIAGRLKDDDTTLLVVRIEGTR